MHALPLDSLLIGELDETELKEVKEGITNLSIDLTSKMVSELKFTVYDNNFNMFTNNYFIIGRRVTFLYEEYEIAEASLNFNARNRNITVRARSRATERMRKDKGAKSFGNISPSVFAASMASKFGLKIFAEDSARTAIKREASENKEESTWDVLVRLARDLEFMCFEARGTLFFASQDFIAEHAPTISISTPPFKINTYGELDFSRISGENPLEATSLDFKASQDEEKPYNGSLSLLANPTSVSIYPGVIAKLPDLTSNYGNPRLMVERVSVEAGIDKLVRVTCSSVDSLEELECKLNTFERGASGDCVKRIQRAVKTQVDGKFGPATEAAVKRFQAYVGLPETGVVDAATWDKIESTTVDFPLQKPSNITSASPDVSHIVVDDDPDVTDEDDTQVRTPEAVRQEQTAKYWAEKAQYKDAMQAYYSGGITATVTPAEDDGLVSVFSGGRTSNVVSVVIADPPQTDPWTGTLLDVDLQAQWEASYYGGKDD
jgi:peptidoglycan hydrolase-like protein with peptidoglycan-binding domain